MCAFKLPCKWLSIGKYNQVDGGNLMPLKSHANCPIDNI